MSAPEKGGPWVHGLESVTPGADIDWQAAYYKLCAEIQDDMRPLLRALGMFDGAQPDSPRQILRYAATRAGDLRQQIEALAASVGFTK